ncbi:hypothetical protein BDB00DRAFT_835877, partial [Zychaea mexicana]|uniref:uncharacterized protein n=1 Tax=Zychaea mexicana TaxID=64656 RepID=UPI0022FE15B7
MREPQEIKIRALAVCSQLRKASPSYTTTRSAYIISAEMHSSRPTTSRAPRDIHTQFALKCRAAAGEKVTSIQIRHAIINEIHINKNYPAAEELFQNLLTLLQVNKSSRITCDDPRSQQQGRPQYRVSDISSFQKSIAKIVRHAPYPTRALYYANIFLNDVEPPLRDAKIENTLLIDLIKQYARHGGDFLIEGLDFVKIGVERGLAQQEQQSSRSLSRPDHHFAQMNAFEIASMPILRHHRLRFSKDGLLLEII